MGDIEKVRFVILNVSEGSPDLPQNDTKYKNYF